jgi:hypothetical protein
MHEEIETGMSRLGVSCRQQVLVSMDYSCTRTVH